MVLIMVEMVAKLLLFSLKNIKNININLLTIKWFLLSTKQYKNGYFDWIYKLSDEKAMLNIKKE